jgi:hypothetical protein
VFEVCVKLELSDVGLAWKLRLAIKDAAALVVDDLMAAFASDYDVRAAVEQTAICRERFFCKHLGIGGKVFEELADSPGDLKQARTF